jgi:uncharacterized membrane protein (UPF0127 family)
VRRATLACSDGTRLTVDIPTTSWERLRGLLGTTGLEPGHGMLLSRTRSIHTIAMRWTIAAALLDRELRVLDVVEIRPGRFIRPRRAVRHVLECRPEDVPVVGVRLRLEA